MMQPQEAFSSDYAQAREKFLRAAAQAGAVLQSFEAAELGLAGETLAMDAALQGPAQAKRLLIISCGSQGADGFTGSALQSYLLQDPRWQQRLHEREVSVLYVHGINPWGMSYWAFTDANNVNFMRNFVDFDQPLPENKAYAELHGEGLKAPWEMQQFEEKSLHLVQKHGIYALFNIYQKGQHSHPDGMYFGGHEPSWAQLRWRELLRQHAAQAEQVAWLDLRRGWGVSSGAATLVANALPDDDAAIARAQSWWGPADHPELVARPDAEQTLIPFGTGNPVVSFAQECPQAQYTGLAAYFPISESLQEMSAAARSSYWLYGHPEASTQEREQIHGLMRKVSLLTDPEAQNTAMAQACHLALQALDGLAQG